MACNLVFVVGTRAQLIKLAPVLSICERRNFSVRLLMTGQHLETIDDLLHEFGINTVPSWIMDRGERATVLSLLSWFPRAYRALVRRLGSLASETSEVFVIVHGDTLSTLMAAMAGRRCRVKVVHVESGLTSGSVLDPFPEEIVRRLVFRVTDIAMCPNQQAVETMQRLGCSEVIDTRGNTIVDSVRMVSLPSMKPISSGPYVVVSLHRFQNIYDRTRLRSLEDLVVAMSARFRVHFILHPATRKRLEANGALARLAEHDNIVLSPRLGYGQFLALAAQAACVLTDGGSNQEELAVLGVPTVVMRANTERPDGLGRNAVLEGDLGHGVLPFLLQGEYERLRTASQLDADGETPSDIIVRALVVSSETGRCPVTGMAG